MPGLLKGGIRVEEVHTVNTNDPHAGDNAPQPRQPTSLQGLLRFAMDAESDGAAGPSNLEPIDDERKKFLEDALKSMTIDVIELLLKQIKVFDKVEDIKLDADISDHKLAFETILDYVDNIDVANDFYKIGGFTILNPCLKSVHPTIRAGACSLLAEVCQNNPFCQMVIIDNDFVSLLLEILDKDVDEVCIKALYALSCIVRENHDGLQQLFAHNGLDVILKTIKKKDDKLRTKSAFLLGALSRTNQEFKDKLVALGYLPVLIGLLDETRMPSHEHLLSLLKTLVEDNVSAVNICRNPQYNLQTILRMNMESAKDKEECIEEYEYCGFLLDRLFHEQN